MLFASFLTDSALFTIVVGFLIHLSCKNLFGQDYAKQAGDALKAWAARKQAAEDQGAADDVG